MKARAGGIRLPLALNSLYISNTRLASLVERSPVFLTLKIAVPINRRLAMSRKIRESIFPRLYPPPTAHHLHQIHPKDELLSRLAQIGGLFCRLNVLVRPSFRQLPSASH